MSEPLVVVVRGLIAFVTLFLYARLLGKRQISQLSTFDYVVGISIGSLAATLTVDLSSRALPHWIGLTLWVGLAYVLQVITVRWQHLAKFINGEPTIVIQNGKILGRNLKRIHYSVSELLEQLRQKNIFSPADVEFAILESGGQLSVLPRSQLQPVTPQDLQMSTPYKGLPTELIVDGVVLDRNLQSVHLDRDWLQSQLAAHGIQSPRQVLYAALDTQGKLYVDRRDDSLGPKAQDVSDYPGPG